MIRLPKGIVTFLCVTVRSSTGDHQVAHLRSAIATHGGVIFHDAGTTIQAAFSVSLPALQAALQTHRHIRAAAGDAATPGLTIALHTGQAHEREGRYVGPTLSRAMSLLAAAHPGQIVLSASTHEALRILLPAEIQIQHLGEFRLKDLFHTEQIYQVLAPGMPDEFPPLQSLDRYSHNLPIQESPLIGREQEVATTCALLRQSTSRLLTLLGSSGMGKTRLALQVAVEVIDDFADGVWFVALAPVSDPTLLASMIAQVLGVKEQAGQSLLETLAAFLHSKQLLLVLDNFEQLRAAAPTISQLLATTRHVTVLVTSQVALDLEQEQVFAVPPLTMPDPTRRLSVDQLSQIPAVALFVERARQVYPSFTLTDQLGPAVIELCTRLEGLPLALELVAAQSKRYFPGDMLIMLQNRLNVARASRRGNTREDTLRPVLDWICEVLGAGVAELFARLGIFAGGCTSESAKAICNPTNDLALDVDQTLLVLLENHLLLREELKAGHVRYTMLDAIHDYARQRLTKRREVNRLHNAHASYYTSLAETTEPLLRTSEQHLWVARLEDEHHNLRAALSWSLANAPEQALRLSAALMRFWFMHGHYTEGRRWLQAALEQSAPLPAAIRAKALYGLGVLAYAQSDYDLAMTSYEAALAIRRELGDAAGVVPLLNNMGIIAMERGEYEQATQLYTSCVAGWRELGDSWGLATSLNNLGLVAFNLGHFAEAATHYEECLALRESLGDSTGLCTSLGNLAAAACFHGHYERATQLLSRGLTLAYKLDDKREQARLLEYQAQVSLCLNDLSSSRRLITDSTRLRQKLGEKYELTSGLIVLANLLVAEDQHQAAAQVLGALAALREAIGAQATPLEQRQSESTIATLLTRLSQAELDAAWQVDGTVSLDDLLDDLLQGGWVPSALHDQHQPPDP